MDSINVENISFAYPLIKNLNSEKQFCLKNISFSLPKGVFLSILGPNGSGKSTLLKLINRINTPDSGKIKIFDSELSNLSQRELSKKIAFVPQIHQMVFPFNVYEIVLMGRSPYLRGFGFEGEKDKDITCKALQKVDLIHLALKPFDQLSGGEKQRVFLARALVKQCPILILDEPNTHLDLAHQVDMFTTLKGLVSEQGISIISVFQDLNLAAMFSDEILLLKDGSVSVYGTVSEILCEKNIKDVFGTTVDVDRHPSLDIPRITLIPEISYHKNNSEKIH
jgi:iron complex transport system ATP-binding protein